MKILVELNERDICQIIAKRFGVESHNVHLKSHEVAFYDHLDTEIWASIDTEVEA